MSRCGFCRRFAGRFAVQLGAVRLVAGALPSMVRGVVLLVAGGSLSMIPEPSSWGTFAGSPLVLLLVAWE